MGQNRIILTSGRVARLLHGGFVWFKEDVTVLSYEVKCQTLDMFPSNLQSFLTLHYWGLGGFICKGDIHRERSLCGLTLEKHFTSF